MSPQELYQNLHLESKVLSATPCELVGILFDEAVVDLHRVLEAMKHGDLAYKSQGLSRSMSIVSGLKDSLNMELSNDLPKELDDIYEFIQFELLHANITNDPSKVENAEKLLNTLRQAWKAITSS